MSALYLIFSLVFVTYGVHCGSYKQTESFQGPDFFDQFTYNSLPDPTHGLVEYVDNTTAHDLGLVSLSGNNFILRADNTTVLTNGEGRKSVRIESIKQWDEHVSIFNVHHMPQGCGTWPAIWESGPNWPSLGEIDIFEGVNDDAPNTVSLHTSANCSMPATRNETGTPGSLDCDTSHNGNVGCGVRMSNSNSYGPDFNTNGGGFAAMERTNDFVKVWFWARNDSNIPSEVASGTASINSDDWGTPDAYFPNTSCDIDSHFGDNNIIINLTFCGDWAGQDQVYASSGCPSTCTDFVSSNPDAFTNAYFEIEWIKVYQ